MADNPNSPTAPPGSTGCGSGCLFGLLVAFLIPVVVFCAILLGNSRNPQCGTPADEGGCDMGLVSATVSAIVIGLIVGLLVWLAMALRDRVNRKPE
jgi:hypothetical protein